jgi:uncharacterized membrane protein YfcA
VTENCTNWGDVCHEKSCTHKSIFPIFPIEVGGIIAILALKICTTMAGVGGGPIITPLCIVLFGFLTKDAVAIGAFATFWATAASFAANFRQRHPEKTH